MGSAAPGRIASVRVDPPIPSGGEAPDGAARGPAATAGRGPVDVGSGVSGQSPAERLAAALLAGSPRVALAGPGLGRADARGWERRGGEEALARALREAALAAGLGGVRIGIADVAVAADAAALVAGGASALADARDDATPGAIDARTRSAAANDDCGRRPAPAVLIVPSGESRAFLAPLPLSTLPIGEELREILRALGVRRAGELAALPREEVEARFGPEGLEAHRWARGEDDRVFRPLRPDELPEASLELDGAVETLEPLLFVLHGLAESVCAQLETRGCGAGRLLLSLSLAGGERREAAIVPARPTRRARLLHDLCRAALERGGEGALPAPIEALSLRVERLAPTGARQGDLFAAGWRDPMEASVTLARLRARLGAEGVAEPAPRADHRPERRSGWVSVRADGRGAGRTPADARPEGRVPARRLASGAEAGSGPPGSPPASGAAAEPGPRGSPPPGPFPSALRLLPAPIPVRVRLEEGRPAEVEDGEGRHALVAAEGPERLSGDWWRDPYRREYFRACTSAGELLWIFREYRPRSGELRWWLHGWWD